MKAFAINDITGTYGAIESMNDSSCVIVKDFPLTNDMINEVGGINSYQDFKDNLGSNKYYKRWLVFFDRIKEKLKKENYKNNDPVQYLIYLYSVEGAGLSISSIVEKLGDYSINQHKDTFLRFFGNIMNWNIRQNDELTGNTRIKLKNRKQPHNKEAKQLTEETIKSVIQILNEEKIEKNNDFNYELFLKLRNTIERTKFILDFLGIIKKENFEEKIIELRKVYSLKVVHRVIQNILDNVPEGIPKVNFNKGRITEICNNKKLKN